MRLRVDAKLQKNLQEVGWEVVSVFGDEQGPAFAFTIGLFFSFRHPEILIMGMPIPLMQQILHGISAEIKNGVRLADGEEHPELVPGLNLAFRTIHLQNYGEFLGTAMGAYENGEFPALQCFWPDEQGNFPWQAGFEKRYLKYQQLLFEPPVLPVAR